MVTTVRKNGKSGPGRFAPARLLLALALALGGPCAAAAQAPPPAVANPPLPDSRTIAKLAWWTMAAVDQANRTGNYEVVRALGSPGFQEANDPARLGAIFAGLRQERFDLSDTLLLEPVYEFAPRIENGLLRMRGAFQLRPKSVQFDLLFELRDRWRLHGIAVRTVPMPR